MYKIQPKSLFIGQTIIYLPSCQSTNDEAAVLMARTPVADGTIVVTDAQTAGRGQRGNVWLAQAGQNLTLSLILKPAYLGAQEQFWLNIAVSLGIYDTLQPILGDALRVKWPNDIYVGEQKLGGVLIENTLHGSRMAWSVVGIGLNVNQTQFSLPAATSLQQRVPRPAGYNLPGLLRSLCETLERRYLQLRAGGRNALRADYHQVLFRYGEAHPYVAGGTRFWGTLIGVDETGRLLLSTADGTRSFGFKEVSFLLATDG